MSTGEHIDESLLELGLSLELGLVHGELLDILDVLESVDSAQPDEGRSKNKRKKTRYSHLLDHIDLALVGLHNVEPSLAVGAELLHLRRVLATVLLIAGTGIAGALTHLGKLSATLLASHSLQSFFSNETQ